MSQYLCYFFACVQNTPLFYFSTLDKFKTLVDSGADVNVVNDDKVSG